MRFLLDENLSPAIAGILNAQGHGAVHVRDRELEAQADQVVLASAHHESRVLISADTDFGEILARTRAPRPSVLLPRRQQQRPAAQVAAIIIANLPAIALDLEQAPSSCSTTRAFASANYP